MLCFGPQWERDWFWFCPYGSKGDQRVQGRGYRW
ncbi:unnamed protein product, partial [Vitis vinifera]|uniref:Uncharacterized protein n=1 Tax=Vitis vinifera TaxID=29760 RepID=D7T005_VITVI